MSPLFYAVGASEAVLRHGWDVYVYNNRTIVVKNLARSVPNLFFVFVSLTKE